MKNRSIADFKPGAMTLREALAAGWRLMTPGERRKAVIIAAFSALAGATELVSIMAVYPLVSVLVTPATLTTNPTLVQLWRLAGEPTADVFVVGLAALAAGLVVAGITAAFCAQVAADRFAGACQERFGRDLLAGLFAVPYVWFAQRNPLLLGSLFLNHVVVWSRDYIRRLLMMAGQLAAILLPIIVLIAIAPLAGLSVLLVGGGLVAALRAAIRRRTNKLMNAKRLADENSHVFLTEALQGIKDVKLSSREEAFLKMFAHTYHVSSRTMAAANSWNLVPAQIVLTIGQIGTLGIALGLSLAGADGATLASIMAVVILVGARVVPAMNRFSAAANGLSNMKTWIEVLAVVQDSVQSARASLPAAPGAGVDHELRWQTLTLENVGFAYPGGNEPVLRAVSLQIKRGGSYAFAGPSGAGKSTIVDIILGLLTPTAGRVLIDGVPLMNLGLRRWQRCIGYVPQAPLITDNSLKANIAFGVPEPRIDATRVRSCLNLANLDDVVAQLPHGLDTPLGDRGHRLSGGQRQRVAIARALYNDPEILVLDEATSALDSLSERAIRSAMGNLHGRVTVISIAHRLSTIEDCDRIFLLEAGKLAAEGSYGELVSKSELFSRLTPTAAADVRLATAAAGAQ